MSELLLPMSNRVGLLNLMSPQIEEQTITQWRRQFPEGDFVPFRIEEAAAHISQGFDTLIITGANAERRRDGSARPFRDIDNIDVLSGVMNWARSNTRLTVYSCLAAHLELDHYKLNREIQERKSLGVFEHQLLEAGIFGDALPERVIAPHSRWGSVGLEAVQTAGITVHYVGSAGWLLASARNGDHISVFLQGHPEYDLADLDKEYLRDSSNDPKTPLPENYYRDDDPNAGLLHDWRQDAGLIFGAISSLRQTLV